MSLHHERGGPQGGPVLVLIHPMGADRRFWDPCRAVWERDFDCLAFDLPAAGASPDPGGALTLPRQAQMLAEALAGLGIERPVPVGCAVGAMLAVELAARVQPAALVLSNPGLATQPAARQALAERAQAARAGGMAAILPAAVARAFDGQPEDGIYRLYYERFAAQDPERYARQVEGMLDADTGPALDAVECPVLAVLGGRDLLLPPDLGRQAAARLPDCTLVEYPEVAHFIPWQAPTRFAGEVADWLAGRGIAPKR